MKPYNNAKTTTTSSQRDECFDDVDIDDVGELSLHNRANQHSSLSYLYKKNRSVLYIGSNDSINRSSSTLMNNNSHDNLGQRFNNSSVQLKPLPPMPKEQQNDSNSMVTIKPNYSPSKK